VREGGKKGEEAGADCAAVAESEDCDRFIVLLAVSRR